MSTSVHLLLANQSVENMHICTLGTMMALTRTWQWISIHMDTSFAFEDDVQQQGDRDASLWAEFEVNANPEDPKSQTDHHHGGRCRNDHKCQFRSSSVATERLPEGAIENGAGTDSTSWNLASEAATQRSGMEQKFEGKCFKLGSCCVARQTDRHKVRNEACKLEINSGCRDNDAVNDTMTGLFLSTGSSSSTDPAPLVGVLPGSRLFFAFFMGMGRGAGAMTPDPYPYPRALSPLHLYPNVDVPRPIHFKLWADPYVTITIAHGSMRDLNGLAIANHLKIGAN
ncbi:hypothetical protein BDR04DRAFT_1145659 [Suillus decipiens]|nr:hypothetical protein BDR04DRAFT_1145659 [Suillus decipiens]